MIIDAIVLLVLGVSVMIGYGQGFLRGLTSLVSPVLGIWFALNKCDLLAVHIDRIFHDYTFALVLGFILILSGVWLGLRLVRRLLLKLVDWTRCADLDQFLGAFLGFARGIALVWLLLALSLTAFPQSVRLIEHSAASIRVLSFGERLGGELPSHEQGKKKPGGFPRNVAGSTALLKSLGDQDELTASE